jgi:hypothetical protein
MPDARVRLPRARLALLAVSALAIAGCGSSSSHPSAGSATTATHASSSAGATPAATVAAIAAAENPGVAQFPAANGRTLRQLGKLVRSAVTLGAATGTFTPGTRRFAFALNSSSGKFVYAPTAIYLAANPNAPASGPFLAPADPMTVQPQYRSKENSGPGGIKAIYDVDLRVPHAGTYSLLSLTRTAGGLVGAPGEIAVAAASPIPNVGQRPPDIETDTAATVHGDIALLTTRLPPEHMASVSFNRVLGKRPIALLFSTPALCLSRVCGPVTDIAVELQHQYGNRITFIHEEVYVDNQPSKGLRPQLKAFHLQTEPWLFTMSPAGHALDARARLRSRCRRRST